MSTERQKRALVCPLCARLVVGSPTCPHDGARPVESTDPRVGSTVGSYLFHGILGTGGMGSVYRGEHRLIGREVAIKVLSAEALGKPVVVERFLLEAKACSLVRHPNVVDVTDYGTLPGGAPYLVMELVVGRSLGDELDAHGAIPLHRTGVILRQVCEALHACHERGIAHRDLKPDNLALIKRPDEAWDPYPALDPLTRSAARLDGFWEHVKVLDFGIARVHELSVGLDAQTQREGLVYGSPYYLSPEQAAGQPGDFRSDIYSLGVILFEMLTGDVPFGGESAKEVMLQHLQAPSPRVRALPALRGLPERVDAVVSRAMAKQPGDRHPTVLAFHRDLTLCLLEAGLGKIPEPQRPRARTQIQGSGQRLLPSLSSPGLAQGVAARGESTRPQTRPRRAATRGDAAWMAPDLADLDEATRGRARGA